jgi:Flp pilus assembly protein TadD
MMTTPAADTGRNNPRTAFGICVALVILILIVFGKTPGYGFVNLDDDLYVYQNPVVKAGLTAQGIIRVFTHSMCSFYHPLTMFSLMLDAQIYGTWAGGFHLTNILLHTATTILLFLLLRQITGGLWPGAFVAAIFAVHPLHVESVAWISERKDVLSGLFFVLTLWAYVRFARMPFSPGRYLTVLLIFALGLLSKPTLVTVPFVMLLLDYWPLGRFQPAGSWRRLILEKIPLFGLVAVASVLTLAAEGKTITPPGQLPLSLQLENAAVSYAAYLCETFCPTGLAPFYPYPEHGLPAAEVAGAVILLMAISLVAFAGWRRHPCLLVGWLWYLGILVPMIGLFQVGSFARADRFTYLPQIGLSLMIAFGASDRLAVGRNRPRIASVMAIAAVLALTVGAAWQTSYWRDSETLWRHTLACTSQNAFAHGNLGAALAADGHNAGAVEQFQAALAIDPASPKTHYDLAAVLAAQNRVDEAEQSYRNAIALKSDYPEAENNLGILLAGHGRTDEAIRYFQKALTDKPDYAEADNNLGIALAGSGQVTGAAEFFQKAIAANPDYADAHFNLANALLMQGQTAAAIKQYQETLRLNPNYAAAQEQLGNLQSHGASP